MTADSLQTLRAAASVACEAGTRTTSLRELDVARHAARHGAPVIAPSDLLDPGQPASARRPHPGVLAVRREPRRPRPARGRAKASGRFTRRLPTTTATCRRRVARPTSRRCSRRCPRPTTSSSCGRSRAVAVPLDQALHGDAHLGNCLPGPVWLDLETACRGPREYDLASACAGRPRPTASRGARRRTRSACPIAAVYAWIAASFLVAAERRPELAEPAQRQLAFLSAYRR